MHREECLNQTRKADVWNCCATAETHTVAQRYKWVCLCSSVESGWYSTLICREQSFSFTTLGMLENESLLKQSANRVLFLTSKLWRQFQLAEQTQRVACANLAESLQSTWGNTIAWDPLLLCNHSDKSTSSFPVTRREKKKKRQTALAAYGILLVKITQLSLFKQFRFESSTSITSGRMQIQACTLCTQPLWLSFSLCQCDSCIAKELL